ncbi:MAG: hypothetical protein WBN80_10675 [Prochlorococcaceae cyanobacterium]
MLRSRRWLALAAALLLQMPAQAELAAALPEQSIRGYVRAVLGADGAAYAAHTTGDPLGERRLAGAERNEELLRRLEDDPENLVIEPIRPFEFRGRPLAEQEASRLPTGAVGLYRLYFRGGNVSIVRLIRRDDGWKVDLRWGLEGRADVDSTSPPELEPSGSPQAVARRLLLALLALDPIAAQSLIVSGGGEELLFLGAPSSPEPSGHLMALAMEMPLVSLQPGEFAALPDGAVAEGSSDPDRLLLLGLFGVVELPFLLRRIAGEWRAMPQPYFKVLE